MYPTANTNKDNKNIFCIEMFNSTVVIAMRFPWQLITSSSTIFGNMRPPGLAKPNAGVACSPQIGKQTTPTLCWLHV